MNVLKTTKMKVPVDQFIKYKILIFNFQSLDDMWKAGKNLVTRTMMRISV